MYKVIDHAASGDNSIVAAVAGKRIRVLGLHMRAAGAVDVRFESSAGGTALTGVMTFAAAGDESTLPIDREGWFETVAGEALNMELSGAVSVDGCLVYQLVN